MSLNTIGWIAASIVAILGLWTLGSIAAVWGIEEAAYTRVDGRDGYEVRAYPRRIVAEAAMPRYDRESSANGFRAVARYIFGSNDRAQKIAMTTPVLMAPAAGLDGTSPPGAGPASRASMAFVLPGAFRSVAALPKPLDTGVVVREEPARITAALRFGWYATPARVAAFSRQLADRITRDGWTAQSAPYLASYNAPFSSPVVLRHDILIDLVPR